MITKILSVLLIGMLCSIPSFAQNCTGTFEDTGGIVGQYPNMQDTIWTFCPADPATVVSQLFFNSFDIHSSDTMTIYNGPDTLATPMGTFNGLGASQSPNLLKATNVSGCLTVRFESDADSFVGAGWEADISCQTIPDETNLTYPIQGDMVTFTGNHIIANNAISANANITFDACELTFNPGFEVEIGSTIQTTIPVSCANDFNKLDPIYASKKGVEKQNFIGISVFPNPFKSATTIQFTLEKPSPIQIQLLDLTGKILKNVVPNSPYDSGLHQVTLQKESLQTGIYFLYLTSSKGTLVNRLIVL